ncbi:hypothetical protein KR009_012068, partial [Drosophila setifemur]
KPYYNSYLQVILVALMATTCTAASVLDTLFPTIISEHYSQVPTKEGYRFNLEDPNGSKREEMGVLLNPDTDQQELVVMGTYSVYDDKTDIQTITMYTADKNGYKARYKIKNRQLSGPVLKSTTG